MSGFDAEAFVAAARSYVGVPWRHQGRDRINGIDCIGLVVCAARDIGLEVDDRTDYPLWPDGHSLVEALERHCEQVEAKNYRIGNIAVFWRSKPSLPQHAGILTGDTIIHAHTEAQRVVEVSFDRVFRIRLHSVWRWRDA